MASGASLPHSCGPETSIVRITVLNGNPDSTRYGIDTYLAKLTEEALSRGHAVEQLNLRDMRIEYCTGCFGCWLTTPGVCAVPDDSVRVCRAVVRSDLVLLCSPLIQGFPSALLKRANDKLIPVLLPYLDIVRNELHHLPRYPRLPDYGLILEKTATGDAEDCVIVQRIYSRFALNFRARLLFTRCTDEPFQEVLHACDRA
jgi:hypothetical protein